MRHKLDALSRGIIRYGWIRGFNADQMHRELKTMGYSIAIADILDIWIVMDEQIDEKTGFKS